MKYNLIDIYNSIYDNIPKLPTDVIKIIVYDYLLYEVRQCGLQNMKCLLCNKASTKVYNCDECGIPVCYSCGGGESYSTLNSNFQDKEYVCEECNYYDDI